MIGFLGSRRHSRLRDLLSAYIDGQVGESEAMRVEAHLSECGECRMELDTLRATVGLLRELPSLEIPRAFTLAHAPVPVGLGWSFNWTARVATSAAGLLVAALVLGDVLGILTQTGGLEETAPQIRAQAPLTAAVAAPAPAPAAAMAAPVPGAPEEAPALAAAPVAAPAPAPAAAAMAAPAPAVTLEAESAVAAPVFALEAESALAAPTAAPRSPDESRDGGTPRVESVAPLPGGAQESIEVESDVEAEMEIAPREALALERTALAPSPQPVTVQPTAAGDLPLQEESLAPVAALEAGAAAEISDAEGIEQEPEADEGLALPLWQLEVGAGALLLLLALTTLWAARRNRWPLG